MTYLEKAKRSNYLLNKHGIPLRCPFAYGLETNNPDCKMMDCTTCWNREMPQENSKR